MEQTDPIVTPTSRRTAMQGDPRWHRVAEIVGWYGAIAVLAAYGLITAGTVTAQTIVYQGLNITGALSLGFLAYVKTAWPSVALNLIWAGIGIAGLAF